MDNRGFESRQGQGIFLFTTASRPALEPTQPPIQWVLGALSLGVKRPGREADHSPPSTVEVENAWSSIPSLLQYTSMAWCSVKSTGTTLPLPLPLSYVVVDVFASASALRYVTVYLWTKLDFCERQEFEVVVVF
jgi:hypothetical protein